MGANSGVMRQRVMRALGFVTLLFVALPITNWLLTPEEIGSAVAAESQALSFDMSQNDPHAVLDQIESYLDALPSEDVSDIAAEISIPPEACNAHWNHNTGVFAFEMEGAAQQVLDSLLGGWLAQGWQAMPLGDACGATLVKQNGTYRWMAISVTQVGSQACIVGKVAT